MDLNTLMDKMKIIFVAIFCICIACQLIRYIRLEYRIHQNKKAPVYTDRATVYCRHDEMEDHYISISYRPVHHITFHTDSGFAVKLYMNSDDYYIIQEGDVGELTWQGDRFWKFTKENTERSRL